MKIAHVAIWTCDLDRQVAFWKKYFSGKPNTRHISQKYPGFESYFISLEEGATIELMTKPDLLGCTQTNNHAGLIHIAISVGSDSRVNALADKAILDGILISKPDLTEDGYYEAVISDPDGNLIEIVS